MKYAVGNRVKRHTKVHHLEDDIHGECIEEKIANVKSSDSDSDESDDEAVESHDRDNSDKVNDSDNEEFNDSDSDNQSEFKHFTCDFC